MGEKQPDLVGQLRENMDFNTEDTQVRAFRVCNQLSFLYLSLILPNSSK